MKRRGSVYWAVLFSFFLTTSLHGDDAIWVEAKDKEHHLVCAARHDGAVDFSAWLEAVNCEKDTEWLEDLVGDRDQCRPMSIAHKLDLSPLRAELAKNPHICISPGSLHQPTQCPFPRSENPLSNLTDLPEVSKAVSDLAADAGPHTRKIKVLGKGMTKTVYLTHLERSPDLEVAAYDYDSTQPAAARLDAEIQLIDSLFKGPNPMDATGLVCPIGTHRYKDGEVTHTTRYMEFLSADSMNIFTPKVGVKNSVVNSRKFKLSEAVHLAKDLCTTVQGLHDRRVVHRDIKPGNLFYDGQHLKIADFDIAYSLDSNYLEIADFYEGSSSAPYLSPELAKVDFDQIKAEYPENLEGAKKVLFDLHARTDDWAVATSLLNILTHEWAPWQTVENSNGKPHPWARTVRAMVEYDTPANQPVIHRYIEKVIHGLEGAGPADQHSAGKLKDFFNCALALDRKTNHCDIKKKCHSL